MKIKTNDNVQIMKGKDRGKTGKVMQVLREEGKVVVEGANIIKKHLRPQKQGEKGRILELFGPVQVSNVMMVCAKCNKPTRVRYQMTDGKKQRMCAKCKQVME